MAEVEQGAEITTTREELSPAIVAAWAGLRVLLLGLLHSETALLRPLTDLWPFLRERLPAPSGS